MPRSKPGIRPTKKTPPARPNVSPKPVNPNKRSKASLAAETARLNAQTTAPGLRGMRVLPGERAYDLATYAKTKLERMGQIKPKPTGAGGAKVPKVQR